MLMTTHNQAKLFQVSTMLFAVAEKDRQAHFPEPLVLHTCLATDLMLRYRAVLQSMIIIELFFY